MVLLTAIIMLIITGIYAYSQSPKGKVTSVKIVLTKESFKLGEEVKIILYVVNQETVDLEAPSLSYQVEISGPSGPVIGQTCQDARTGPVLIPAKSECKIGEFIWDQRDSQGNQVQPGAYSIRVKLIHLNLETNVIIQIQ